MKGAHEYASLFTTGQHGRLYLVSGSHARGLTFRIFVLPADETAIPNHGNAPLNKDAIEVYGITGGQPGWTETYGWLHEGRWQDDFDKLVREAQATEELRNRTMQDLSDCADFAREKRTKELLATY